MLHRDSRRRAGAAPIARHGGSATRPPVERAVLDLQTAAGNRAVVLDVQRQPSSPFRMKRSVEGEPRPPRDLREAIARRRLPEPLPDSLDHGAFTAWVETTDFDRKVKAALVDWSSKRQFKAWLEMGDIRSRQHGLHKGGTFGTYTKRPIDRATVRKPGWVVKSIAVGGYEFGVGLAKGVQHAGRWNVAFTKAVFGDDSDLRSLAADDAAFFKLIGGLFAHPLETVGKIATGYTAIVAAEEYLTKAEVEQIKSTLVSGMPEKVLGMIGKKALKSAVVGSAPKLVGRSGEALAAAITALYPKVAESIASKASSLLVRRLGSKVKGAALSILSVIGMIEEARAASLRLRKKYPLLYEYLKTDDLHMAWFLVESNEETIRREILSELNR